MNGRQSKRIRRLAVKVAGPTPPPSALITVQSGALRYGRGSREHVRGVLKRMFREARGTFEEIERDFRGRR